MQRITGGFLSGSRIPEYSEVSTGRENKEFLNQSLDQLYTAGPSTVAVSARISYPQYHVILKHPGRNYQLDADASQPQMPVFVEHARLPSSNNTNSLVFSVLYLNRRMQEIWEMVRRDSFLSHVSESQLLANLMFPKTPPTFSNKINAFCNSNKIRVTELCLAFPMLFSSAFSFIGGTVGTSVGDSYKEFVVSVKADTKLRNYWPTSINGDQLFFVIMPREDSSGKRSLKTGPPQIFATGCTYPEREKILYEDMHGEEHEAPVICVGKKKNDERLTHMPYPKRIEFHHCGNTILDTTRVISVSIENHWYHSLRPTADI